MTFGERIVLGRRFTQNSQEEGPGEGLAYRKPQKKA
jgi:hypothetical protein